MGDQKKELSDTIWTDTKKLSVWKKDLSETISNEWSKILDKNQIPISLDRWEKDLAKKRISEN